MEVEEDVAVVGAVVWPTCSARVREALPYAAAVGSVALPVLPLVASGVYARWTRCVPTPPPPPPPGVLGRLGRLTSIAYAPPPSAEASTAAAYSLEQTEAVEPLIGLGGCSYLPVTVAATVPHGASSHCAKLTRPIPPPPPPPPPPLPSLAQGAHSGVAACVAT